VGSFGQVATRLLNTHPCAWQHRPRAL